MADGTLKPKSSALQVHLDQLAKMRGAAAKRKTRENTAGKPKVKKPKRISMDAYNRKYGEGKHKPAPKVSPQPAKPAVPKAKSPKAKPVPRQAKPAPRPEARRAKPSQSSRRVAGPTRVSKPVLKTGGRTKRIIMGADGRPSGQYRTEQR